MKKTSIPPTGGVVSISAVSVVEIRAFPISALGEGLERKILLFQFCLLIQQDSLYNENPALGAGGSEALLAMGQDKETPFDVE